MQVIKQSNGFTDLLNGFAGTWVPAYMKQSADEAAGKRQIAAYEAAVEAWKQSGMNGPMPQASAFQTSSNIYQDQPFSYPDQIRQTQQQQSNPALKFSDLLRAFIQNSNFPKQGNF